MHRLPLAFLTAGFLGLAALPAGAALNKADQDFVEKAASGSLAEVQAAQLAQQRGSSPQIKQFANRMITDHTQASAELQQIADQENITLPTQPSAKDMAATRKLSGLNGPAFDTAYAQDMLHDHQQDVALFRKQAQSGQDPALKAFAQKTLPILQQHLQLAQGLQTRR